MAASSNSQSVTRKQELCTNLKKMPMKKLLKSVQSREPSEEVRERRRCFIATSLTNDSQDRMTLDDNKSRRFTLAMTKEQEAEFFKSLWKSVPEKSAADCTMHKPLELNVMSDKRDVASESLRENKNICDINGNHFQDETGIGVITIGDDASSIEPLTTSRSTGETGKIFKIRTLDLGGIQVKKDSIATVCDTCRPPIGDSNNGDGNRSNKSNVCDRISLASNLNIHECVSTCDETQTETTKMSTNVEVPKCNCAGSSYLMKANAMRVDQSQSIPTYPIRKSLRSGAALPNIEDVHLTRGIEADPEGFKERRSVLTQTSPMQKCNHSSSGQSLSEKGHSVEGETKVTYGRKWNNDHDLTNKRPPHSFNNVNIRQRHHFEQNSSNRRPKFSYTGQRRKNIGQNDCTQCTCVSQCPKWSHSKQDVCDHSSWHNDANTWSSSNKCHTKKNHSTTHAQTQFRIRNLCSNCSEKTNNCVPNPSIRDNSEDSSYCRCSIRKQRNATTVNKSDLHSVIPKQKNIQSLINAKTCGSKHLRQGIPNVIFNPQRSFRNPSEGRPYSDRCSRHVSTEVCGRCDDEIQEEPPESSYGNDVTTSAPPEFCGVCCVRGNSDKQMKSHFKGNRHWRMVRESATKFKSRERVRQCTCSEDMKIVSKTGDQIEVLTCQTTNDKQRLNPEREYVVVRKVVVLV